MTTKAPIIKEYDIPIRDNPLALPAPNPLRIAPIIIKPIKVPERISK